MLNPVFIKGKYFLGESEFSAMYLVRPVFMPAVERLNIIAEKLFNCPNRAIPEGPTMDATTFILIKAAIILIRVEIPFKAETVNSSLLNIFVNF